MSQRSDSPSTSEKSIDFLSIDVFMCEIAIVGPVGFCETCVSLIFSNFIFDFGS